MFPDNRFLFSKVTLESLYRNNFQISAVDYIIKFISLGSFCSITQQSKLLYLPATMCKDEFLLFLKQGLRDWLSQGMKGVLIYECLQHDCLFFNPKMCHFRIRPVDTWNFEFQSLENAAAQSGKTQCNHLDFQRSYSVFRGYNDCLAVFLGV